MHTTETIPDGVGFSHYGLLHFVWLFLFVVLVVGNCLWYRKMNQMRRSHWKKVMAVLLLLDELYKVVFLIAGARYTPDYLPLHLCSINIFIIAIHAWKPSKMLSGFLYTVCIPGALAALLFPTWTSLPLANFMHIHSFTVHILLAMYPLVLGIAGELKPEVRKIPQYLLLLLLMAIPIYGINLLLDTNFMFLMSADPGNPLYLFEQMWGNHLLGFPVLIVAILLVMFVPMVIFRKLRSRTAIKA